MLCYKAYKNVVYFSNKVHNILFNLYPFCAISSLSTIVNACKSPCPFQAKYGGKMFPNIFRQCCVSMLKK